MTPDDVVVCKVFGTFGYVLVGYFTAMVYDWNTPGKVYMNEMVALALIWPLVVVVSVVMGFGRLLLRLISAPRKIQNTINAARVEARGVSVVKAPDPVPYYDVEPVERWP